MTDLQTLSADYLSLRRGLGARLTMTHWLLDRFVVWLTHRGAVFITTALALEWATEPRDVHPAWWARRLSEVRQFARYAHAIDPRHEVPPERLLPSPYQRRRPYIYSDAELDDLIGAARRLPGRLQPQTCATMLGLLAVTGMRSGEVVRLERDDVDLQGGVLTIRESKFGKSRLNFCHPSTLRELREYAARRDARFPHPQAGAFFLTDRGRRVRADILRKTFRTLSRQTGLRGPQDTHGPRLTDLRHRFAVRTLTHWYRNDVDVDRQLPRLSTWLGHASIVDTYWYLTAVPELMEQAARRLDDRPGRVGP